MRKLPPNFHSYEHGSIAAPRWTLLAPAQALLPLIRWPLGYETLSPWVALKRAAAFAAIPPGFWFLMSLMNHAPPANEGPEYFDAFIAGTFLVTLLRFGRRAAGQHKGEEIHTAEAGYSAVTWLLRFPMQSAEQLVVPGLIGWGGWEIAETVSVDLGYWLMACAVSYLILANWEVRNVAARKRAPVDDKIRAQAFSNQFDEHEEKAARSNRRKAKGKASALYDIDELPEVARAGRR